MAETFLHAYLVCALWSSMDESTPSGGYPLDENYSVHDFAPEALKAMTSDCDEFQTANADLLVESGLTDARAGHDFWLTRNGHGAGFWDRGLGEVGRRLTDA